MNHISVDLLPHIFHNQNHFFFCFKRSLYADERVLLDGDFVQFDVTAVIEEASRKWVNITRIAHQFESPARKKKT